MEERALRAFFVVVEFHSFGELVDGFGKLMQTLVEGRERLGVGQ
jgi:hypothetical protein